MHGSGPEDRAGSGPEDRAGSGPEDRAGSGPKNRAWERTQQSAKEMRTGNRATPKTGTEESAAKEPRGEPPATSSPQDTEFRRVQRHAAERRCLSA